ncbi:MAG: right-handed parallel beta-helix repeat-containing protein [Planctomycetota bacterium]
MFVIEGTYLPGAGSERIAGDTKSRTFFVERGVGLYGGFLGGEVDENNRLGNYRQTILSGNLGASGMAYNVIEVSNLTTLSSDLLTVIDGFQIAQGAAYGPLLPLPGEQQFKLQHGGGIYAGTDSFSGGGLAVKIHNCFFLGNSALASGGAVYVDGSKADAWAGLFRCHFQANRSDTAAGAIAMLEVEEDIYSSGFNYPPYIYNSTFEFNLAGAETDPDAPTFAGQKGGAIAISPYFTGSPLIYNCLFHHNFVRGKGAAIAVFGGIGGTSSPDVNISNCSITENTVLVNPKVSGMSSPGGIVSVENTGQLTMSNSIIWNNFDPVMTWPILKDGTSSDGVAYSDIECTCSSGTYPGTGNIRQDPQFVTVGSNYHLKTSSPCIDRGCTAGCTSPPFASDYGVQLNYPEQLPTFLVDYEYDWSLLLPRSFDSVFRPNLPGLADMGCYEVQQ